MEEDDWDHRQTTEQLRMAAQTGQWCDLAPEVDDNLVFSCQATNRKSHYLSAESIRELLLAADAEVDPRGLKIRGAIIIGALDLAHISLCRLEFLRCQFDSIPNFEQATLPELVLNHVKLPGLILRSAHVAGNITANSLVSNGAISASYLHVDGKLSLRRAGLMNMSGRALILENAVVTGGLDLDKAVILGETLVANARIDGDLMIRTARLANPGCRALVLDGAHISGGIYLNKTRVLGELRAPGTHVGGQFALSGARISGSPESALLLEGAELVRGLYLNDAIATGEIRAPGATIGLQLSLTGARITNHGGTALSLNLARITGSVYLVDAAISGDIQGPGVQIDGKLDMKRTQFVDGKELALNLSGAVLNHLVLIETDSHRRLDLSFSSILIMSVGHTVYNLPPLADAQGWNLGMVHGFLLWRRKDTRSWLGTIDEKTSLHDQTGFASQPWKEVAKIYERVGQPEDAQWLRHQAAKRTTQIMPHIPKLLRRLYNIFVGYGYYPHRAAYWLVFVWLTVVILCFFNLGEFISAGPQETSSATGQFNPFLYALDIAVPAASSGQAEAWAIPNKPWLPSLFALLKGFSWFLTALLLAGVTGLLRRE